MTHCSEYVLNIFLFKLVLGNISSFKNIFQF